MSDSTSGGRPVLVFDGDCGFCRRWIERWRLATGDRVHFAPSAEVGAWFPQIDPEAFAGAVHLVEPDGRVSSGAEAVYRALARAPSRRWLLWLYRGLPGFARASEIFYRQVAARRSGLSRLSRWLWGATAPPLPTFFLTRWLFLRGLGVVYLLAFLSLWGQVDGLIGPGGILPAGALLERAADRLGTDAYRVFPTLAWLLPEGWSPSWLCAIGIALSVLLIVGVATLPVLALLWAIYLSVVAVGQDFLSFQWDTLLLETGFLALFLAPLNGRPGLGLASPPPRAAIWMLRWLLFKLMFMSGVVKLVSGDETWWALTALQHHHETQPLPTWIGWHMHHLPAVAHRISAALMFVVELILPFLVFAPRRLRLAPAAAFLLLQAGIALSGNYGFFNLLTALLVIPLLDDHALSPRLPRRLGWRLPAARERASRLRRGLTVAAAAMTLALGGFIMAGRFAGQASLPAPASSLIRLIAPFRSINGYGLFASMTTRRPEIVIEGSADGRAWKAYGFPYKPGDLRRRPRFVAPHMPRLDWQMWFAALQGDARAVHWYWPLAQRLLEGSPAVRDLLAHDPFPEQPPRYVRALLYDYRFSSPGEDDAWWQRRPIGIFAPPVQRRGR